MHEHGDQIDMAHIVDLQATAVPHCREELFARYAIHHYSLYVPGNGQVIGDIMGAAESQLLFDSMNRLGALTAALVFIAEMIALTLVLRGSRSKPVP